jgi:hypothetical protein
MDRNCTVLYHEHTGGVLRNERRDLKACRFFGVVVWAASAVWLAAGRWWPSRVSQTWHAASTPSGKFVRERANERDCNLVGAV